MKYISSCGNSSQEYGILGTLPLKKFTSRSISFKQWNFFIDFSSFYWWNFTTVDCFFLGLAMGYESLLSTKNELRDNFTMIFRNNQMYWDFVGVKKENFEIFVLDGLLCFDSVTHGMVDSNIGRWLEDLNPPQVRKITSPEIIWIIFNKI